MTSRTAFDAEIADLPFVLHGRALRPGYHLEDTARFDDDDWALSPASVQQQERGLTLRFDTVPALHRTALKRLCYAMLSGPTPDEAPRPRISSVATGFYNLRIFLRWLETTHPDKHLPEVTTTVYEQYQRHLLTTFPSASRRFALRSAVNILWRYRGAVAEAGLQTDPRRAASWSEPDPGRSRENTTERIPEAVHSRVLVWAMRFVDDFSGDVIAAIRSWSVRRRPVQKEPITGKPYGFQQDRIRAYLARTRRTGSPLPGLRASRTSTRSPTRSGATALLSSDNAKRSSPRPRSSAYRNTPSSASTYTAVSTGRRGSRASA
ncbi:hypothetical protein [Microbacterium arborescens]|uniref:hypothetical protein n=1 Tax=Microbacterium arborescens TaxID=33883 RepID=UPI0025A19705|nr:hypothetical protein [Microbacterium arborescens]WJM17159.1 hypothetical protein QUC20_07625 [Microbacterium arborescens]